MLPNPTVAARGVLSWWHPTPLEYLPLFVIVTIYIYLMLIRTKPESTKNCNGLMRTQEGYEDKMAAGGKPAVGW